MGCSTSKVASPAPAKKMEDVKTVPDDIKCVEDNKNGERTFKDVEQTPTAVDWKLSDHLHQK